MFENGLPYMDQKNPKDSIEVKNKGNK